MTNEQLKQLSEGISKQSIPPQDFDYYISEITKIREELHGNQKSHQPTPTSERDGLAGEMQFSNKTGLPADFTKKKYGDDHFDFYKKDVGEIDVKTTSNPRYWDDIYVEPRKLKDDEIYVRGKYIEDDGSVEFLGWEYGKNIKKHGVLDRHFSKKNPVETYKLPVSQARPMRELYDKLGV
jgi:hypothetical protein